MDGNKKLISLNRNQIKYIVIAAMLIDHIAWAFVPTDSLLGQIMHFIGRLTGPTMAYFVVEGYIHTRDVKKYAMRLGIFALISIIPFTLFEYGTLPIVIYSDGGVRLIPAFGVIYTLFLSLLAVWFWDKFDGPQWQKLLGIFALCLLSGFGDWPVFDVIYALFFFKFKDDNKRKWFAFCVVSAAMAITMIAVGGIRQIFGIGVFMIPFMLTFCYNGECGSKKPIHKWFFYIFYPAHLLVLAIIKIAL